MHAANWAWEGECCQLHVANLDVQERGVANDLDGRAIDLTWQTQVHEQHVHVVNGTLCVHVGNSCKRKCGRRLAHLLAGDDLCTEDVRNVPVEAIAVVSADDDLSLLVHEQHGANHPLRTTRTARSGPSRAGRHQR